MSGVVAWSRDALVNLAINEEDKETMARVWREEIASEFEREHFSFEGSVLDTMPELLSTGQGHRSRPHHQSARVYGDEP